MPGLSCEPETLPRPVGPSGKMVTEKEVEVEGSHGSAPNEIEQLRNVESGGQADAPLKPTMTEEHREYLINRHGTTDLLPVPSMDPQVSLILTLYIVYLKLLN